MAHSALSTGGALLDLVAVAAAVALAYGLKYRAQDHDRHPARASVPFIVARRLHDGSLGDSATWGTLGTATIALALATTLR